MQFHILGHVRQKQLFHEWLEVYWNYLYKWCDIKKKQIEPIDWNGKKPNKTELCGHMNIDERAEKLWKVLKAYIDLKGQK